MLAVKRHEAIIELLEQNGSVKVSELKELFKVTDKTVREDLEKLEQQGFLTKIHGGAVLPDSGPGLLPMKSACQKSLSEKTAIAQKAVRLIEANDIIALDSGTTTLEIAKLLPNEALTVVTNDLYIISELIKKEHIRLVVPGGYRSRNLLVSPESPEFIHKLNIKKAFISTTGIHPDYGFTIFTSALVEQKRAWIESAKSVFCVADHSKFDQCALLTFAKLDEVDQIITDSGLPESIVKSYDAKGIAVNYS
ncbi:MAG: DeoR family transcriptional regulator [Paenibacillus sp. RIFOXYA1_FULL_44_5]|nr:MAG: DeoR family transcriptional regulator [Paenibacillus sp. RIFOXYA1_FULL_44_5]